MVSTLLGSKRASRPWLFGGMALVLGWACGGPSGKAPPTCSAGEEGCECYANDSCNGELECFSGLCVDPNRPAPSGGAADPGSTGGESVGGAGGAEDPNEGGTLSQGGASKGGSSSKGGTSQGGTSPAVGGEAGSIEGGSNGVGGAASSGEAGAVPTTGGTEGTGGSATGGSGTGGSTNGGAPTGGVAPTGGAAQGGDAGSSGALLFFDDFEDGTLDGWTADSWMVLLDGNNHVLRQNPDYMDATSLAMAGNADWTDRWMEVSVQFTAPTVLGFAILGSHLASGTDDRDQVMVDVSGSGTLLHAEAGDITSTQFAATIAIGTWYKLAIEIQGTTLRGYFDGVLVAELHDITGINGGVGVTATQVGDIYYDDLLVRAP